MDSHLVSMRIWIRIQGDKPMRIHADPDPGQTLSSQKSRIFPWKIFFKKAIGHKTYLVGKKNFWKDVNEVYLLITVPCGSWSRFGSTTLVLVLLKTQSFDTRRSWEHNLRPGVYSTVFKATRYLRNYRDVNGQTPAFSSWDHSLPVSANSGISQV